MLRESPDLADIDTRDFTRFDPVPKEGMDRALAVMQTGEIFRYSGASAADSEVALLEREFADYVGTKYALGVNSCSAAIQLALICSGVTARSKILLPGFTFSAVPSAVSILGAIPVFVECNDEYRVDIDDLRRKATPDLKFFLLSHMRGHLPDMDAIVEICEERGITLIEDAAHALGARWRGRPIGSLGRAGCFSFQSNKILNTGEGGMLATDDEEIIVKAIYLSGAYENNHQKHFVQSPLFEALRGTLPLHNARMTNVTAAMARPQIRLIETKGERYREMYAFLRRGLVATNRIIFPRESENELRMPDSIQFRIMDADPDQTAAFVKSLKGYGLPAAGFADRDNARAYYNWRYLNGQMPDLPQTRQCIANACDMRLPSMLKDKHLNYIVEAVRAALHEMDASSAQMH